MAGVRDRRHRTRLRPIRARAPLRVTTPNAAIIMPMRPVATNRLSDMHERIAERAPQAFQISASRGLIVQDMSTLPREGYPAAIVWQREADVGKRLIAIAFALGYSALAIAGETSFAISCDHSLQAAFDEAVAMIDRDTARAHEMFHVLAERDKQCAAFHWGLARTVRDPEKVQQHRNDGFLAAAINAANAGEWEKLSALLH
jgi:hypothetical protein